MLDGVNLMLYGIAVSAISFFGVLIMTPAAIRSLIAKRKVVPDAHKPEKPQVPRPAGPVIMISIAAAEIVLFFLTMNIAVFAILLTTAIAFIGGVYGESLNLIFGRAYIPLLYIPFIFVIIPITGNTINSIDVLNGVASSFLIIATIPLLVSIAIFGSREVFLAALPLLFATLAFYKYHKFPSRIFPGDSGTLLLGAMYGAVAIAGSSEIIGVIALLPAVMNSFLFLASVKRIVEHREVKARPTILTDDFKLAASSDSTAPATLVRLIVADRPLAEREIIYQIFKLATFTALLAFASIAIQYMVILR
jgi:UDP-N-acetylglucosamine--dolichyl-phosphate N-acetylglucosaminephosphotransferase